MQREQTTIQIGLRVPESISCRLDSKAREIGVSKNALLLMLIDMGFRAYDGNWHITFPGE